MTNRLDLLRSSKRALHRVGLSFRNSARAFSPHEAGSRLKIGTFDGFEVAYREGTTDEKVIEDSFANDPFLPAVPEFEPAAGAVVLDVGAHIGTFALLMASRVAGGRVYAVEPSRETFDYLRVNQALNHAENVEVSRVALSDRQGSTHLYHDFGSWGHSIQKRLSGRSETVPTTTLAAYLEERGIARCDFVKLNCEGAEFPLLLAAPPSVLATIGAMLILYHLDLAPGFELDGLLRHLEAADFRLRFARRSRSRGWLVAWR